MTTRRGFLGAIIAAAAAPAIIKAEALMPVRKIVAPSVPWEAELFAPKTIQIVGGSLRVGDVFTVAGVKDPAGGLKQWRVASVSSGVITLGAFHG